MVVLSKVRGVINTKLKLAILYMCMHPKAKERENEFMCGPMSSTNQLACAMKETKLFLN